MSILSLKRQFTFENYGGTYQLRITSMADLSELDELDEPFWMATSAPVEDLRCEKAVLPHLDPDGSGRVLSREIRTCNSWLREALSVFDAVDERRTEVVVADLNQDSTVGQQLAVTARRILDNLSRSPGAALTLADVRNQKAILAQGDRNGDGVIPPDCIADDVKLAAYAQDIIDTMGGVADASGAAGVDTARLKQFSECLVALNNWRQRCDEAEEMAELLPLGAGTAAAHDLLAKVQPAIDAYFDLCRLALLNRLLGRQAPPEPCPPAAFVADQDRQAYFASSPIAAPSPDAPLPLLCDLNPHYRDNVKRLTTEVVDKLLPNRTDPAALTEGEWQTLKLRFAGFREWLRSKSGGEVERLPPEKLTEYLTGDYRARLQQRIDDDLKVAPELKAVNDLEKLLLLQRWFLDVCNNFISFPDLYHPDRRAMFEVGRLVIDGRIFKLNIKVADPNVHAAAAQTSGIYLLYSEVTGAKPEEKFFVVTPITSRRLGNLGVNKRGVLFDLTDREWDTRVIKVVDNPVSMYRAIMAPFRRLGAMMGAAVDKITSSTEKQLEKQLTTTTTAIEKGVVAGVAAPPPPAAAAGAAPAKQDGMTTKDMFMTGGVTLAALGSSFAFVAKTLADVEMDKAAVGLLAGLGLVLIPVIIVAAVKLYCRNLSSVLEASGWAVNGRMRLTRSLAKLLAPSPVHPDSFSKRSEDVLLSLRQTLEKKSES